MGQTLGRWTRGSVLGGVALLLGCGGSGSPGGETTWALVAQKPDHLAYDADVAAGKPVEELMPIAMDAGWLAELYGTSPLPLPPPPTDPSAPCAYGAKYDLRTLGRVTPARNPTYPCGTCFTNASLGSLESYLAPGTLWDFSESHMQMKYGNTLAGCGGGANSDVATYYLSSWRGPVRETDYAPPPWPPVGTGDPQAVVHVQNVYFIPARTGSLDNCWIKWAVQNLGGVYSSVSKNGWGFFTSLHYYHPTAKTNHAVTIVGWDDDFDRNKFLCLDPTVPVSQQVPAGNGAFIVKDNQGPSTGEAGFLYVSYYDGGLGRSSMAAFTGEPVGNYTRIYQYDAAGGFDYLAVQAGDSDYVSWQANVFTAAADESLAAVGFLEFQDTMDYQVLVHLDPTQGPLNPGGPVATVDAALYCGGYYTVPLPQKVPLKKGQKFSVVLKAKNRAGMLQGPIRVQRKSTGYEYVTAAPGRGWVSGNGLTWTDLTTIVTQGVPGTPPDPLTDASLCIKAYTKAVTAYSVEMASLANGNHWVWEIVNEGQNVEQVKPVAQLYRPLAARAGFERFGADVFGTQYLDAAGAPHPITDGWVPVGPGQTVRVLAPTGATDLATRVGYEVYGLDGDTGLPQLTDIWRYLDLVPSPLHVVSTTPASGATVAVSALNVLRVTFDRNVKVGPGLGGIEVRSLHEWKAVYPSVSGNQLVIVSGIPNQAPPSNGLPDTLWTVTIPADAVVDEAGGNPLAEPYTWTFTVNKHL